MPNKDLQKLIDDFKTKKFRDGEAKGLVESIQEEQTKALKPVLEKMASDIGSKMVSVFNAAIKQIKVQSPSVNVPDIQVPPLDTTQIADAIMQAVGGLKIASPNVHVPPVHIPEVVFPHEMDVRGWVQMELNGKPVGLDNALPVTLRDKDGKPVDFSKLGGGAQIIGAGGGRGDFFTIQGFGASAFSGLQNPDGRIKVELPSGASGLTDTELRASAVPVAQVSGANWSVNVVGSAVTSVALTNSDGQTIDPRDRNWTISETLIVNQVSGAAWSVSVNDIFGSTAANVINPDGRIKVELPSGASGLTDTELRASHLDVQQVSGAVDSVIINDFLVTVPVYQVSGASFSVNVVGATATVASVPTNAAGLSGNIPSGTYGNAQLMVLPHDTSALSDAFANTSTKNVDENFNIVTYPVMQFGFNGSTWDRAGMNNGSATGAMRMVHAADAVASVNVVGPIAQGDAATALRVVIAGNSDASVVVNNPQNQGDAATALRVVIAGNSDASVVVNNPKDQGDAATALRVVIAGNSDASVFVNGFAGSVTVFQARQTNPTAVADGADVRPSSDDLGRQLVRLQARDLVKTAYVSVTNGTETTLLAAVAGAFLDCVSIMGSNNSDAAVSVDVRAVTGGNIVHTLRIPANATAGWVPSVPWPQDATGNNWTIDGPDETGRTLTFSALFSQEV